MFDVGQPTRLTINTAGKYLITGYVEFDNPTGAGAFHELTIRVNGSNRIARELNVPIAGEQPTTTSMYYSLNAGDYVELIVRQVSGSSQNYDVPEAPALMVVKVP